MSKAKEVQNPVRQDKNSLNPLKVMQELTISISNSRINYEELPKFQLTQLRGKKIEDIVLMGNSRPVLTSMDNLDPPFEALLFKDRTFLLFYSWGDGESQHIDFYYWDGKRTYFSADWQLFNREY